MDCPKCRAQMDRLRFQDVEVDRCAGCGGLWFDILEHRDLERVKGSEAIDAGDPRTGKRLDETRNVECPADGVRMIRMVDARQPHIAYESCPVCHGVFFDAGEFRDLKEQTVGEVFRRYRAARAR